MADNLFALTPDQEKVVGCDSDSILVVASAGTGKTEVVARRIERILSDTSDSSPVLALTYTVKAANELRKRIQSRLGDLDRHVNAETIHQFAHSLLLQFGTYLGLSPDIEVLTLIEDRVELLTRWLDGKTKSIPDDPQSILHALDLARAKLETQPLLAEWEAALASIGAVDYPGMLSGAIELLSMPVLRRASAGRFGHVIVDEAQNLTPAQYRLLTLLIGRPGGVDHERLAAMLVGDAKQSVVGFAGADCSLMDRFCREYGAEYFRLEDNFRSAEHIAVFGSAIAEKLVPGQTLQHGVSRYPARGCVEVYEADDEDEEATYVARWVEGLLREGIPEDVVAPGEARHIEQESVAVMARSSATLNKTNQVLEQIGINTASSASPEDWLSTRLGRLVLAMIDLRGNPQRRSARWQVARLLHVDVEEVASMTALAQTLESHPVREGLVPICSMDTPEFLVESLDGVILPDSDDHERHAGWDADRRVVELTWGDFVARTRPADRTWTALSQHIIWAQRGRPMDSGVRLITVHKAQGREFRAVAVVGLNEGQFPDFRAVSEAERREEMRTFYVAVTRPSRMLLLTRARTRYGRYGRFATDPSSFVDWTRPG